MLVSHTPIDKTRTIHQLIQEWEQLAPINAENRLAIEHQKLHIIEAFEALIKKDMPTEYMLCMQEPQLDFSSSQTIREILYYFLLVFGLFEDGAGSYLFGSTLFALIPGLSTPMLAIASLIFVALSSTFFYAFQATFLRDALGIPHANNDAGTLLKYYTNQLHTIIAINKLLTTIHMLPLNNTLYNDYIRMLTLLNEDLRVKHSEMGTYNKSTLKNSLEVCLLAFGAVSSIAGSYFMASTMINLLTPVLVGTPIGWAIISMTIFAGLVLNYAMGVTSISRLVNPDFEVYQTIKEELSFFKTAYPDDLKGATFIKSRFFERQPMADACTQTEDTELENVFCA